MFRFLPAALLVLGLAAAAPVPVSAQSTRAYAPENLRQLSVPDRVRVLEREYADQSGGRQLPDDQLEFYLAQIDSGWNFSRIKQDIAASLRGQGGGNRPGAGWGGWNGSSWTGQTVICSSIDDRRRECQTPFQAPPALVENISRTRCVEGVNFGGGGGRMWVDQGCRGRFTEGRGGAGNGGAHGQTVRCESQDNRERTCNTPFRGRIVLAKQLSRNPCVEGQSWAQQGSTIMVRNGCRGDFAQAGGGWWGGQQPGYTVTCSSDNDRRRSCAWDRRQGRPVLVENISSTRCQEGQNWGWDGNAIWVDRGCRARFGSR